VTSLYIQSDEIKILPYPDLLIRLLLDILTGVASAAPWHRRLLRSPRRPIANHISTLRRLLDSAEVQRVTEDSEASYKAQVSGDVRLPAGSIGLSEGRGSSLRRSAEFTEDKRDYLERHLSDFKRDLATALRATGNTTCMVIVDDFYLVHPSVQPDVIDYLHRLFRGTAFYLKIGTVRHRTSLSRHGAQTIGVELSQDVEELNLDQTFEDVDGTKAYLAQMLDSLAQKVGIVGLTSKAFNPDGLLDLTLASGGVPRDYLNIFVEAIKFARGQKRTKWLTPTAIYKGADRVSYRTKLSNLQSDLGTDASPIEKLFADLVTFCLKEKKKTAFLISQEDVTSYSSEHDAIKQLMDFKLIHIVDPHASAASGRQGRFEAYTLDFSLFMEPRLRGIEHVEFWKVDEQRRRKGIREAPHYELKRARGAMERAAAAATVSVVEQIRLDIGSDPTEPS